MAIDVLTYNALQEVNEKLKEELQTLTDDIATASASGGGGGGNADAIEVVDSSSMLQANQWCRIPTAPETGSFTNGFKVCDATGYYRCGQSCTWAVPGGTTCV